MGQSSDQIRQEIEHNRSDAAEKIDQLQGQVQGSADHMREQVKGTVDDTVQTLKQQVESFDVRQQVEQRPMSAVGVAFVGGMLLGGLTGGGGKGNRQQGGQQQGGKQGDQSQSGGSGLRGRLQDAAQRSGLEDAVSNATAALMGSVSDQFKSTLDQRFPGFSEKMQSAQQTQGDLADKSRATQQAAGTTTVSSSNSGR